MKDDSGITQKAVLGTVGRIVDDDQWATTPKDLTRIVRNQLDPDEMDAPGLLEWVESRWGGPVFLGPAVLEWWLAEWRTA